MAASKPGTPGKSQRDIELEEANAEIGRLSEAVKELAVKLRSSREKGGRLMPTAPVPARVDAGVKDRLLDLVEHATDRGWPVQKACTWLSLAVAKTTTERRQDAEYQRAWEP